MPKRQADKSKHQIAGTAVTETAERDDEARRDAYRVKLEIFEGPLDLLLYLIRKDEIDIYDIPISHITEQYLAYLELMQELDIAVAGDFLVMASTLIYIKSKMLLPPEPKVDGEEDLSEDPRAELIERLLEYQKFKSASQMLYSRGEIESACYTRGPLETDSSNPEVSATVLDLLRVFREVLKRAEAQIEMEIARDEMTIAEKLTQIHSMLDEFDQINVRELFEMSRSKRELIITFLALLELVKEWRIYLVQRELFGDIFASKRIEGPAVLDEAPVEQIASDGTKGEKTVELNFAEGVENQTDEAIAFQSVEEQAGESIVGNGLEVQSDESTLSQRIEDQVEESSVAESAHDHTDESIALQSAEDQTDESIVAQDVEEQTDEQS